MIPIKRLEIGMKDITAFIRGHFKRDVIQTLEEEFAEYIGSDYALFTSSCRSALYLTYKALKLSGEVIAPPLTCSVALQPIVCCGSKIRFADIDPYTFNINHNEIDKNVTKHTCAIQIIHLAGNPCDMNPIKEIAEGHNLPLIEDCAQALGVEYKGRQAGSFGDIACFSLTKNLFGIRGGIIVSNEQEYISKIRELQQELPKAPYPLKYYFFFREYLDGMRGNFAGDLLYYMLSNFRKKVVGHEDNRGIGARHLTDTLGVEYQNRFDRHPLYSRFDSVRECKNYLQIHDHMVSLPISSNMRMEEIEFIAEQVRSVVNSGYARFTGGRRICRC